MTAAKEMDVIARITDCDRPAVDAVSSSGWRMLLDRSERQRHNVQIYGYVFHDRHGPSNGPTWKIQWVFLNEICADTHVQASCGKDNSRKFWWDLNGEQYRIGNVCLFIGIKDYSCRYTWTTSKWLEERRIWLPCGRSR